MNLARHATLLLKYRAVAIGGLVLACALAFLAAYQVPSLERRGSETWSAVSSILVTQPGFPEGRVTLPTQSPTPGLTPPPTDGQEAPRIARASPIRSGWPVWPCSTPTSPASEQVRSKLPEQPAPGQIAAVAVDATGNGTTYLPIIALTTQAASPAAAQRLNVQVFEAFEELLQSRQRANDISERRPDPAVGARPALVADARDRPLAEPSLLAFLLCCLATWHSSTSSRRCKCAGRRRRPSSRPRASPSGRASSSSSRRPAAHAGCRAEVGGGATAGSRRPGGGDPARVRRPLGRRAARAAGGHRAGHGGLPPSGQSGAGRDRRRPGRRRLGSATCSHGRRCSAA